MSQCVIESNDWTDSLSKNSNNIFNQNLFNDDKCNERLCSVQNAEIDDKIETSDTEYKVCHTAANVRAKPPMYYKRDIKTQRNKTKKQIMKARKKEFMKERLPELFRQMQLLDITIDDVTEEYKRMQETDKA